MKLNLNPYAMLLTTGALMLVTVLMAQSGSGGELVREGAKSVDRDIASFAAKALHPQDNQLAAASDAGPVAGGVDDTQLRVANVEGVDSIDGQRFASR